MSSPAPAHSSQPVATSPEVVIATIGKNSQEQLRVSLTEFRGHRLINIRVFYVDKSGVLKPGKQGLALRLAKLPELRDALTAAIETAKERGLA